MNIATLHFTFDDLVAHRAACTARDPYEIEDSDPCDAGSYSEYDDGDEEPDDHQRQGKDSGNQLAKPRLRLHRNVHHAHRTCLRRALRSRLIGKLFHMGSSLRGSEQVNHEQ